MTMTQVPGICADWPPTTDGEIAVINLDSSRQAAWSRFWQWPLRPGIAELILEQEQLSAQFLGDVKALDRCAWLVGELTRVVPDSSCTALIAAHVASMAHRFSEARDHLTRAKALGADTNETRHLELSIDQATGERLDTVLAVRRMRAEESGRLDDLVPLAALLADFGEYDDADRTCVQALRSYRDVSPFALAWLCFQQGQLWGERVPRTEPNLAARWYEKAIEYLPSYAQARVHLAELLLVGDRASEAEALLLPVASFGNPEACWRLAEVMEAQRKSTESEAQLALARSGFEDLLRRHVLAFADHGAEFYAGLGDDPTRAFELANLNLRNRATLRAFEQAYVTALAARLPATEILAAAQSRWGNTKPFRSSPIFGSPACPGQSDTGLRDCL
jgi:hypothetical protein